jgi:hypothetical protein
MELATAMPVELAAIADPSARGAAPLLTAVNRGGNAPGGALPFALCLELLTEPSLSGEAWPANGKDLPPPPADAGTAPPVLEPAAFLLSLPAVPADAPFAVLPPLASASESTEPLQPPFLPLAERPAAAPLPSSTGLEQPLRPETAAAPTLALELDALGAQPPVADAAGIEHLVPRGDEVAAKPPAERTWLDAFMANEARIRASQPVPESRPTIAPAAAVSVPTSAVSQLKARAEIPLSPTGGSGGRDEFRLAAPLSTGADTSSFGVGDWLPPAGASTGTTSAAAGNAASLPSTPVDVRTPNWQEAFASRVQWLVETQTGEAHIKLNPPELGAVDVKISLVDDKTYVQLTTATAAAREELAQSLPRLRELLTVSGLEVGGTSVHNGHDQQPAGHGHGTAAAEPRAVEAFFSEPGGDPKLFEPRRSLGRIDVFA